MTTIFLKYAGQCTRCGMHLQRGRRVYYNLNDGIRCTFCGPHPLLPADKPVKITTLPPGTAEGAIDSTKPNLHADHGMNHNQGEKKHRNRLPTHLRRARQRQR